MSPLSPTATLDALQSCARNLAAHLDDGACEEQKKIERLRDSLSLLEASLEWTQSAGARAQGFVAVQQGRYLCPVCWVLRAQKVELCLPAPIPGIAHQCPACDARFPLAGKTPAKEVIGKPIAAREAVTS